MQSTNTKDGECPEARVLSDMASGHGHQQEQGHGKLELPHYRQWEIDNTIRPVQEKLAAGGQRTPGLARSLGTQVALETTVPSQVYRQEDSDGDSLHLW